MRWASPARNWSTVSATAAWRASWPTPPAPASRCSSNGNAKEPAGCSQRPSCEAAPDARTRGVLSVRRVCERGRQRSRWASFSSSLPGAMTEAAPGTPSIDVGELLARVDAGEPLLLLDVRNDDEFETWRVEGRRPAETVHVPYFDFIEDADGAASRLPRGRKIVVMCAQGGSSAMVVE